MDVIFFFFSIFSPSIGQQGVMAKDADQASGGLVLVLKQLLVISCFGIIPSLNKSLNHC